VGTSGQAVDSIRAPPGLSPPLSLPRNNAEAKATLKERQQEGQDSAQSNAELFDSKSFVEHLRVAPLPAPFVKDVERLMSFRDAVKLCVESIYYDRLVPTLGEIYTRLRCCGWQSLELRAVLLICAHEPARYKLVPPSHGEPLKILLQRPPHWFEGWLDSEEVADSFSCTIWDEFKMLLTDSISMLKGGIVQAALALRQHGLPPKMQRLSLGELRHLIRLALSPQKSLLIYDRMHGGRLLPSDRCKASRSWTLPDSILQFGAADAGRRFSKHIIRDYQAGEHNASCVDVRSAGSTSPKRVQSKALAHAKRRDGTGDADALMEVTDVLPNQDAGPNATIDAERPWPGDVQKIPPPTLSAQTCPAEVCHQSATKQRLAAARVTQPPRAGPEAVAVEIKFRLASLQHCIQSFYCESAEPTLGLVQQRLLQYGWTTADAQFAPLLCSRHPDLFTIIAPSRGEPMRVHLRCPPAWCDIVARRHDFKTGPLRLGGCDDGWDAVRRCTQAYGGVAPNGGNGNSLQVGQQCTVAHVQPSRTVQSKSVGWDSLGRFGTTLQPICEVEVVSSIPAMEQAREAILYSHPAAVDVPRGKKIFSQI